MNKQHKVWKIAVQKLIKLEQQTFMDDTRVGVLFLHVSKQCAYCSLSLLYKVLKHDMTDACWLFSVSTS